MNTFQTLYKLSTSGKARIWEISSHTGKIHPYYKVRFGDKGGKIQETCTYVKVGKNIGKANETTPYEQCYFEAESLWNKKKNRGGYQTSTPSGRAIKPMLAKSYDKDGRNIKFPCFIQPKLDGSRMLASWKNGKVNLVSRQNKKITSMTHIQKALSPLLKKNPKLILDGELYVHGSTFSFQDLMSAIKRDEAKEDSTIVEYHIYDMISDDDFEQRTKTLSSLELPKCCKIVQTKVCESAAAIDKQWSLYTKKGYEGIMLRNKSGKYKIDARSSDLQKYKKFMDAEFRIVGMEMNKGRQSKQCTLICETESGKKFGCKPKGSDSQREQYVKDYKAGLIKGKMLTVRFFSWTDSEDKVPRFPVGIGILPDRN